MTTPDFSLACIGGRYAKELLDDGILAGTRLGSRKTPFGTSQPIYRCEHKSRPFFLLLRHSDNGVPLASSFANHRANVFALKELGVSHIVSWSGARAVSHNFRVGQFAIPDDLIDETRHRAGTFFEHGALLDLRQWPVFCPTLRLALAEALGQANLKYTETGTYLCGEGPRRETRAEVRKYAQWGADLLGHSLAPEAFLAKELQMCYASLCFIDDFAETGSVHRPYEAGSLFQDLGLKDSNQRARDALDQIPTILGLLLDSMPKLKPQCTCQTALAELIASGTLAQDFHEWFHALQPAQSPPEEKPFSVLPLGLPVSDAFSAKAKKTANTH